MTEWRWIFFVHLGTCTDSSIEYLTDEMIEYLLLTRLQGSFSATKAIPDFFIPHIDTAVSRKYVFIFPLPLISISPRSTK